MQGRLNLARWRCLYRKAGYVKPRERQPPTSAETECSPTRVAFLAARQLGLKCLISSWTNSIQIDSQSTLFCSCGGANPACLARRQSSKLTAMSNVRTARIAMPIDFNSSSLDTHWLTSTKWLILLAKSKVKTLAGRRKMASEDTKTLDFSLLDSRSRNTIYHVPSLRLKFEDFTELSG